MVVVSYSGKEINAKLVYYGAGLSGKTTNLESIYEAVPDTSRGKMVSMKTQSDRTLFFDLLPLDLGEIMGFKTRFLLYTVPGQVFYNATRKLVLKGADAIVFVADSEVGKMEENKESLANLKANLAEYGLSLDAIPWVIQYNKRDLPNVYSLDELNAELNSGGKVPFFEAVATQGKGVFETFRGISHLLMEKVTRDLRRGPTSGARPMPTAPSAAANAASAPSPVAQSPVFQTPAAPAPPARPVDPAKAEEQVRPFGPARLDTAAPAAPGRVIEQEAQRANAHAASNEVDYGVEIELPSPDSASRAETPAAPAATDAPEPQRESTPMASRPVPEVKPEPKPALEPVHAAATAAQNPVNAPQPAAQTAASAGTSMVKNEVPKPASGPQPPAKAEPRDEAPALGQAARGGHAPASEEAGSEPIVLPVRIPKGWSREIVLRIVISAEDDSKAA